MHKCGTRGRWVNDFLPWLLISWLLTLSQWKDKFQYCHRKESPKALWGILIIKTTIFKCILVGKLFKPDFRLAGSKSPPNQKPGLKILTKWHHQGFVPEIYRQVSNIRRTKFWYWKDSRAVLWLSLPNPLKPDVENEDVVGAAPTGDAPTTSEWSTILLPTKVRVILKVLRYISIGNACWNACYLTTF